ncbi:hypothetical protein V3C10_20170 [[Clostridium] symbiosum]|uniref:hypothetical protein n=1 Tax=Clostridium symbiosum TaxID=1512 RepID=UPI001D06F0AB|nr:hypothetical protein [[Clostridium] symbiosum]MCB6609087.1 hypothetical protein [[Clostridium] symbiosum]MCB6930512.1 hypothetical protein [[Clostridium] symbiosum]
MVFPTSSSRRKAVRSLTALPLILLLCLVFTLTALAHDAEYGMWHGEQNALIIGTVEEIDGTLCRVTVNHAFTCGPEGAEKNVIDRMLPVDEIPASLTADLTGYDGQIFSYLISYHGKTRPEKGDFVLLSLDKKGDIWDAVWGPYEVSGTDPNTLELLPEKEKGGTAAAWEVFIHSGGAINDFKSIESDRIAAYIRQEDGTTVEETVWEKAADTSDAEADGTPESQDVSASDRTEESMAAADGQDNRTRETGEGSYHSNFWPLIAIFAVIFLISIALGIRLRKHFRKK